MPYDIAALKRKQDLLAKDIRDDFVRFFKEKDQLGSASPCDVASLADIDRAHFGASMYVIFSDFEQNSNPCTPELEGLKAIYRGHCWTTKNRLLSHLFNGHYRARFGSKNSMYSVCMKLGDSNGININEEPFSAYKWKVAVYKMRHSTKLIREQAELAFDEVFKRPLGSREVVPSLTSRRPKTGVTSSPKPARRPPA